MAKSKDSSKRTRTAVQQDTSEPITLLVRRGALRRYDALKRKTAGLPVVVDWDRRLDERRGSPETMTKDRRRDDRRTPPSFTWELADFVIVAPTAASAKAIAALVNGTSDDDRDD